MFLGLQGKQNLDLQREDLIDQHTRDVLRLRSVGIILTSTLLAALAVTVTMLVHN